MSVGWFQDTNSSRPTLKGSSLFNLDAARPGDTNHSNAPVSQGALRSQLVTKVIDGQVQSIPGKGQLRSNVKMYHGRIGPRKAHKEEDLRHIKVQK